MKIKNWSQFQHFKDRKPPWIKLYRDLLDDVDWFELDPKDAKNLVMLWLMASENMDGELPPPKTIAFRLRMKEKDVKSMLSRLSGWFDDDDIRVISEGYQVVIPETETETETETYREEIETEFEMLWKIYPSAKPKGNKQQALKKYIKIRKDTDYEEIRNGLGRYAEYIQATGSYNQHCTTWFNQEGWKDGWEYTENKDTKTGYLDTLIVAARKTSENIRDAESRDERYEWDTKA